MIFFLNINRRPFQAEWKFGAGAQVPVQIYETGDQWLALIGRIYSEPNPNLKSLYDEVQNKPDAVLSKDGRFIFIHACKRSGEVQAWTDKYRLLGGFIHNEPGSVQIGNSPRLAPEFFGKQRLDADGITDLLSFGYVLPPLTLYKNVRMLAGYTSVTPGSPVPRQSDWRHYWPNPQPHKPEDSAVQFYSIFRECTNRLVAQWKPRVFRMSAGADSRLIVSALDEASKKALRFEVVCAPYLNELTDRDVIGAKKVAQTAGAEVAVKHFPADRSSYFGDLIDEGPVLTGLYGGELLGGVLFGTDPAIVIHRAEIGLAWPGSIERWERDVERFGKQKLLTSVYLGAFRSSIYGSVMFSWARPSQLNQITLTPFVENKVLDFLLALPSHALQNYSFYAETAIKSLSPELKKIPFSSPIVNFTANLSAFSEGIDPKFRVHVSEETETPIRPELLQLLNGLGIKVDSENPTLRLRLINLQNHSQVMV